MSLVPLFLGFDLSPLVAFLQSTGGEITEFVKSSSGILSLLAVAVYSFLIAVVLPLPSEIVLFATPNFGLPPVVELTLLILVSGIGKAAGSVFAFRIGHGVKESGPVIRALRRSPVDVVSWSERKTVEVAQKYGYIGLALALSIPFFPDTISIYAFTVLEKDYVKFAAATFAGSVGRLLVTIAFFTSVL
ncbi:MAG: VTT domain-containing protein [Halobacteriales archaeon]|nr:VTT domain-containing protein [Halobacteriales archaeon]